ncbi:MAG: type II toxin-antitoxin system RelE/ParE family toxin [Deltaproteobacteria bacterium]|nr:type II toxin-antitoxin system RelE/ParE family toxin [Deltaproteobacteria bacterium]
MKKIHVAAITEDELREARDWYEGKGLGLGRRFVEAINLLLTSISENSRRFPVVHGDVRQAIVPRFPYGVFFIDEPERVHVIGVVHLHRHPDTWKKRA